MTTISPIAGNDGFKKISNASGQQPEANISDFNAYKAHVATTLTANRVESVGRGQYVTRIAYAPRGFNTLAVGQNLTLMNKPNCPAATGASDANLFILPPSVLVTSAVLTNNGTPLTSTGSPTFTAGLGTALNGVASTPLFLNATLGGINGGVKVGGGQSALVVGLAAGGFGTPGLPLSSTTFMNVLSGNTEFYLNVTGAVAALTGGDLALEITYFYLYPSV